jgi:hypothetical protein
MLSGGGDGGGPVVVVGMGLSCSVCFVTCCPMCAFFFFL